MTLETAIAEAKATGRAQAVVDAIPYMGFLGLAIEDTAEGPVAVLPAEPKLIGNPTLPALHGGVVGALLESAAVIHLIWSQDIVQVPKIINITVEYLRPAGPKPTRARGLVTKHGRRVANVQVEAWQDDPAKPVAIAYAHFLLRQPAA